MPQFCYSIKRSCISCYIQCSYAQGDKSPLNLQTGIPRLAIAKYLLSEIESIDLTELKTVLEADVTLMLRY